MVILCVAKTKEREQMKAMELYQQEVLKAQVEVQKRAFERVGSELYDNIGQLLSVAKMNLFFVGDSPLNADQQKYVQQTSAILGQSINDIRALIQGLKVCMGHDFDLQDGLRQRLLRIRYSQKAAPELLVTGTPYSLGYEQEIVLFRVSQEILDTLLDNSLSSLIVQLQYTPTCFVMTIESGVLSAKKHQKPVFDAQQRLDIHQRLALFGATVQWTEAVAETVKITIQLPNPP